MGSKNTNHHTKKCASYRLDEEGRFTIENYHLAHPFASFFPGIAGVWGIPLWVFYVNRAQGIASFGIESKDGAMMEFYSSNRSFHQVHDQGFRTFLKIPHKGKTVFYEPFQNRPWQDGNGVTQKMSFTAYDLLLEEVNLRLGIKIGVRYFTIPHEPFGALARTVRIENISRRAVDLALIDGVPWVVTFGLIHKLVKSMTRTTEAWVVVENTEKCAPYYRLKVAIADKAQVSHIQDGHFFFAFHRPDGKKAQLLPTLIDPAWIFDDAGCITYPYRFITQERFIVPRKQVNESLTPCAMTYASFTLAPGGQREIHALFGHARGRERLNLYVKKVMEGDYLEKKYEENKTLIESLQDLAFIHTGIRQLNLYSRQNFLDNLMRGGLPFSVHTERNTEIFYIYSRKHGDLERDYNKFQLDPTYYSQGNGNFRDINQNRRNDIWFNPKVEDTNIITFFNLLQLDGYNPLIVKRLNFHLHLEVDALRSLLKGLVKKEEDCQRLQEALSRPFTPGQLMMLVEDDDIQLLVSEEEFLREILNHSSKSEEAEHFEGFWIDHWTYNTDLLESFLSIYPEKARELLFAKKVFTFYDNQAVVLPREERIVLLQDGRVRQYRALKDPDEEKAGLIRSRPNQSDKVRTDFGKGDILKVSLLTKLLCVIANKLCTFDSFGAGIEMEAGKPGWYDALNGLPGIFGSSVCEAFELKRLLQLVGSCIKDMGLQDSYTISVPVEIAEFLEGIDTLVRQFLDSSPAERDFVYWDASNTLKEDFRKRTKLGTSGKELEVTLRWLEDFFGLALRKLTISLEKAYPPSVDIPTTYFSHEVVEYEKPQAAGKDGVSLNQDSPTTHLRVRRFRQTRLPLFLEGPVHALRVEEDPLKARRLYRAIRNSPLYDKKLGMYKVNASLGSQSHELGRTTAFTPGWLENESVWLHMEYKYLFELLRSGLYEEFYQDFRQVLIPFQKPERYGHSILENSSFIVSSAHLDRSLHGRGFVARLSGSTAEFIHIWLQMCLGRRPFFLDEKGNLCLEFRPILAQWLFTKKKERCSFRDQKGNLHQLSLPAHTLSFLLLGQSLVVYHNPKRRNTFGKGGVKPVRIELVDTQGELTRVESGRLSAPFAQQVREGKFLRLDIHLA